MTALTWDLFSSHRAGRTLTALALVAFAFTSSAQAQNRLFVHEATGVDTNPGTIAQPKKTIQNAVDAMSVLGIGTVVLLPDTYTDPVQQYPVEMRPGVSLQGTNALNTVLVGNFNNSNAPLIRFSDVLADESGFLETFVNGLTLTECGNQAIAINGDTIALRPTISNCVIVDNCIGVGIIAVISATPDEDTNSNGITEHQPTIFQCTISQNFVGVYDAGIIPQQPPGTPPVVFGESRPAIVNCAIMSNYQMGTTPPFSVGSDLFGVDNSDILGVAFGTSQGVIWTPTSGCTPVFHQGQLPCSFLYPPVLAAGQPCPQPTVALPPNTITPAQVFINPASLDFRLLPFSQGANPLVDVADPGVVDASGNVTWTVGNGTVAVTAASCEPDALAVDLEGHGNSRLQGGGYDIGADEMGQLIVSGFTPMTTRFSGTNTVRSLWMVPQPALSGNLFAHWFFGSTGTTYLAPAICDTPGVRPSGTVACDPTTTSPCSGTQYCLNPSIVQPPYPRFLSMPAVGTPRNTNLTPGGTTQGYLLQHVPQNGAGSSTCFSNLQYYEL